VAATEGARAFVRIRCLLVAAVVAASHVAAAQEPTPAETPPPTLSVTVTVVGTTPLPGVGVGLDRLPAPVQTATSLDIQQSGALDLSAFMNARLNGVHVNEVQGNPYQPDVNYRGYTASPLLGTPQGVSVYMDGVRLNQPFGDVVSWDLIPRAAIATMAMMPGSNPVFGLNTLGGALALETKTGRTNPGTTVQFSGGRDARRAVEFEHGGSRSNGLAWYVTGNLFAEDGWRDDSPSDVRQIFGKVGWLREHTSVDLTVAHADNSLTGNGLQEQRLLDRDRASIYTKPDNTQNRSTMINLSVQRSLGPARSLSANVYYRRLRVRTINGDINDDSLEAAIYQPDAAERGALAAAGYTGVPVSGASAANTPFPSWRCIANVLLQDEPGEKCNGLKNRSASTQGNGGFSAQVTRRSGPGGAKNQITVGTAFDRSAIDFSQSSELGYLSPDRGIVGLGVFADGINAGDVDGEPFDLAVDMTGHVRTASVYVTDMLALTPTTHLTVSGRYNHTTIENRDLRHPGGGTGSLDGTHAFGRLNPAAGITSAFTPSLTGYASYSEGSRAPTSIELGCADPESPCKLPNAMAGDPPLDQVVARTVEAGLRGHVRGLTWSAGWFHARNTNDILFVTAERTGFGYFTNFGETRRQGLELDLRHQHGRLGVGVGYTLLDATFRSEETVAGEGNSTNDEGPGLEGAITIQPGDRMPLIPRHLFKVFADVTVTNALSLDVDLVAASGVFARGNENNAHEADGFYYLGPGQTDGYAIVNLGARYQLRSWLQLFGQVNNLLNTRYVTAAQLGVTGFTATGAFLARPLPAVDDEFPQVGSTFYAPGAPATAWGGARVRF
jgi:outer membrane receptor protein involved in Fe transport